MLLGALGGFTVAITDDPRSGEVAELIAALGGETFGASPAGGERAVAHGPSGRLAAAVADRLVDAVVFTSAGAVTGFVDSAETADRWTRVRDLVDRRDVAVCCVGPATVRAARVLGLDELLEPATPTVDGIVRALVDALGVRSVSLDLCGTPVRVQGRSVMIGDAAPVRLADRERGVLDVLVRRPGAVVSKQSLVESVWGGSADAHAVEVTVARLRARLGPVGRSIGTVVRRGYRLEAG